MKSEDELVDEEVQQMLRIVFVKYNQKKFGEIISALSSDDIKLAHRLMHTLKGNAGQVGKAKLFDIASKIESLLRDSKLPIPEEDMTELKTELDIVLEEFRPLFEGTVNTDQTVSAEQSLPDELDMALKGRILIIDDNASSMNVLAHIFRPEYTVYEAVSGQDAVAAASEYLPDIVLLDILMSGMDGYAIVEALKSSEITKDIPVIFITGLDDADAEEKALNLGAADYIIKPFSPTVVKLRVRNQVRIGMLRRESELALASARAASRAKSDFLANMSNGLRMLMNAEFLRNIGHELKTSLTRIQTSIINAADLIDFGMDIDEMRESLEDAGQEIMKMAELINCEIGHFAGEVSTDE